MKFLFEIALYAGPCFFINACFNLFYEIKRAIPGGLEKDTPFDFGKMFFDGNRILGQSTTWGGLVVAFLIGGLIDLFSPIPLFGLLKGMTTFFGHAFGSFIKRRLNLPRAAFLPFIDHGDYMILTGIVFYFAHLEKLSVILCSYLLILLIQPLICFALFSVGLREKPF